MDNVPQEEVLNVLILEVVLKLLMVNVVKIGMVKILIVIVNGVEVLGNGNVMVYGTDIVIVRVLFHMVTHNMIIVLKLKSQVKFKCNYYISYNN
jgi:hypothetical protein